MQQGEGLSHEKEEEERIPKPRKTSREMSRKLTLREALKSEKPDFARQESWRYKRVKPSWRRPKGLDSKMRLKKGGWPKSVGVGYRSPRAVRGFHPSGFEEVIVHNVEDLKGVKPSQAVRIGHTVGGKKRAEIIKMAEGLRIHILNKRVKAVEAY